jgi:outer membrane receptor for ferrienterochelin and colicin
MTRTWLLIAAALFAAVGAADAQTLTGTISGHVADAQGLALPGVTVTAESGNLQGIRTVTTSGNGDYVFTLLPSGTYKITFDLSGFQKQERTVTLAPTQTLPLDVTMGISSVAETVNVVGRAADVLTQTAQVASNFKQDLIATLPTNRDINSTLLLAPSVTPTGPGRQYSIAGSMSFDNNFMINGVVANDNIRGNPNDLYIEDAIQETNIMTSGISAEFGRFQGGVVNVVTKSGGNIFSGSFRDTLNNDNWRTLTPYEVTNHSPKTDKTVPAYEYTLGGPVAKDHLWFFTAGRLQDQQTTNTTIAPTNLPYTFDNDSKRYEGKGTFSINSNHTFQGSYIKIINNQQNDHFGNILDLRSTDNRKLPQDLWSVNYNGILSSSFFVETRFSGRHFSFVGSGAPTTDLIQGTLVIDRARNNSRYWSPTFCGVCDPEKRDNNEVFLKGSYFLSSKGVGSHNMVFGYDTFNDERFANNHQSGSDFRILGTTSIIQGSNVYPQFLGDGSTIIQYNPILQGSLGTNFRTHSLFYNDNWRMNSHLTLNLGLRYDKNHGEDSAGQLIAKDSGFSPRVGVVWDPIGDQNWSVTGSFAKYVAAVANSIADSSSAAGNPATFQWAYLGPSINPSASGPLVTTDVALQQLFAWFNANGGQNRPYVGTSIPGVATKIPNGLDSPNVLEYAAGVNRQIGSKGAVRVDYVFRDYKDFYATVTNTSTGKVTNSIGNTFDLNIVENTNAVFRRYQGVSTRVTYRLASRTDVGVNYTLSHAWGNFDGENSGSGPITTTVLQYPEYKQQAWIYPTGDLGVDQRHRAEMWVNYGVPRVEGFTVSVLQHIASGVPYGAIGPVDARPYVTNPGYITPQGGTSVQYYFTNRDAFRTDTTYRTDLGLNYDFGIKAATRRVDLFVQGQVINVFNNAALCGCGNTVFLNGGGVDLPTTIDQSVLTKSNTPSLAAFNPFTTTPAQGTNWQLGPNFGKALNRFGYESPREFRISFGVRF